MAWRAEQKELHMTDNTYIFHESCSALKKTQTYQDNTFPLQFDRNPICIRLFFAEFQRTVLTLVVLTTTKMDFIAKVLTLDEYTVFLFFKIILTCIGIISLGYKTKKQTYCIRPLVSKFSWTVCYSNMKIILHILNCFLLDAIN